MTSFTLPFCDCCPFVLHAFCRVSFRHCVALRLSVFGATQMGQRRK